MRASPPKVLKPIVKWAGGKSKLLGELLPRVPQGIRTYYEPFFGGGALFVALASHKPKAMKKAVIADRNPDLVACYKAIRDNVDGLIRELGHYHYDHDLFYATRARDVSTANDVVRGARLLFLNHTCFNGLWRVNSKGEFNVPFGRYTNPKICNEPLLRGWHGVLQGVTIQAVDFATITKKAKEGDFVYFDPPYMPVSRTANFASYGAGGFGDTEQTRLRDEFARLAKCGTNAVLSNADTPASRALYKDFSCFVVKASRRINSNIKKRGDASELIVTNWGKPGLWDSADVEWSPDFTK